MHDVIIIGGSYAGMAAALQLVRARRQVLVLDAGRRRNRTASRSHGFLGRDGADPAELAQESRAQLAAYPSLQWSDDVVVEAAGTQDAFTVTTGAGAQHQARRLLLAIGVSDALPEVAGLAERWGTSVFHCPYCHGFELDSGRIGVIASGPVSVHQAAFLPEWGEVTFFLNGVLELDPATEQDLVARGITIERTPIAGLDRHADVALADGRCLSFAGLFTAPRNAPSAAFVAAMGCTIVDTPLGTQVLTNDAKETSIAGVYACGDVARVPHSIALAVADGSWAGAQVHRSLVFPSEAAALRAR